jgi:hypothetical protein
MKQMLLLFLSVSLLGCVKRGTPQAALPGCDKPSVGSTRSGFEADARRYLEQNNLSEASLSLKRAACYEGSPDVLLLDLAARATLWSLIQKRAYARQAAELLLETPGGLEEIIHQAQQANPSVAVSLWSVLASRREESAKAPLFLLAQDSDPSVRAIALRALLVLDALSVKDAEAALASELPAMRIVGVEIAARYQPSLLATIVEDKDTAVRMAVVSSLPRLSTEEASSLALLLVSDEDIGVRLAAFELSIQLGIAKQETLAEALLGNDPLLALSAARIAGPSSKEALQVLLQALDSQGPSLRNALLLAGSFKEHAKEIAPKLQRITSSGTPEEQVLAASALLRVEPELKAGKESRTATEDAMSTLSATCETEGRAAVRACAKQRLRVLALRDPDPVARATALRALGLFGQEFLNELSACLADTDESIRFTAAQQILKNVGATPRPRGRQ